MDGRLTLVDNSVPLACHFDRVVSLARMCSEVILVSPFLMEDFSPLRNAFAHVDHVTLVTTLRPHDNDQIQKVNSFLSLFDAVGDDRKLSIRIDNKLHGKVYIFKAADGRLLSALITSANLTNAGLNTNHEFGVEIADQELLRILESSVTDSTQGMILTRQQVLRMKKRVDAFLKKHPRRVTKGIALDFSDFFPEDTRSHATTFWLKPIGVTGSPIKEGEPFDRETIDLYFSKKKPKALGVDDIVVAYAVKFTKILAIFRVISPPSKSTPAMIAAQSWKARWPWYVYGRNLTPHYGRVWAQHNVTLRALQEEFRIAHPKEPLTFVGGRSLGGLNFGLDKLHLNEVFASHIISRVQAIDQEETTQSKQPLDAP
jgi:NgoFVII restriction endonuclease